MRMGSNPTSVSKRLSFDRAASVLFSVLGVMAVVVVAVREAVLCW
jgi:hypothetical protein